MTDGYDERWGVFPTDAVQQPEELPSAQTKPDTTDYIRRVELLTLKGQARALVRSLLTFHTELCKVLRDD